MGVSLLGGRGAEWPSSRLGGCVRVSVGGRASGGGDTCTPVGCVRVSLPFFVVGLKPSLFFFFSVCKRE